MQLIVKSRGHAGNWEAWKAGVRSRLAAGEPVTLGIASSARQPVPRACADAIAQQWSETFAGDLLNSRFLVIHTELMRRSQNNPADVPRQVPPSVNRSPLGRWYQVEVPIAASNDTSESEHRLANWLSNWRRQFRLTLLHLGPLHLPVSRRMGKLTDGNLIVLGPGPAASPSWLLSHIEWHRNAGSTVCGTILTRWAA